MQKIKLITFDVNGVLLVSKPFTQRFAYEYELSEQVVVQQFKQAYQQYLANQKPGLYRYWKEFLDKHSIVLSEEAFLDYWFNNETLNTQLVACITALKRNGFMVVALSNNFKEAMTIYTQSFPQLAAVFDQTFYSWQTGFVKPDEEAFTHMLKTMDVSPDSCIFFDDAITNVQAAKRLGINAYLYTSYAVVQQALNEHSIELYAL